MINPKSRLAVLGEYVQFIVTISSASKEYAVSAFIRADRMTFKAEFGDNFYYDCVRYSSEWVEVDETTIPKWMIDSSVFCDWEI